MPSRDQQIAKAVTWNWDFLQETYSSTDRCYRLNDRQVALLLAPLVQASWRTRWHDPPVDFEDVLEFIADIQARLLQAGDCGNESPCEIIIQETVIERICGVVELELDESEDDMGRLSIEVIEGVAYLNDDCGCGVIKRYRLQEAQIDPRTGAIGSAIDQIPDQTTPVDPQGQLDCYYSAAADKIIQAMTDFVNGLAGYFLTGVFNAVAGAAIETQQVIYAIASGNASLNFYDLGYTEDEIISALTSQGYRAWLAEKLQERNIDGQINRWSLLRLTQIEVPQQLNLPTPVTPYINWYGLSANLGALNNQLSIAAAVCGSGVNPLIGQCWEIDLTKPTSLAGTGLKIMEEGGVPVGEFIPGVGLRAVNIGQWNLKVVYSGLAGKTVSELGYTISDAMIGGSFLRAKLGYDDDTAPSGSAVNLGAIQEQWITSGGVITSTDPGYGWFFNALNADQTISHLRIKFSEQVSPAINLSVIDCP